MVQGSPNIPDINAALKTAATVPVQAPKPKPEAAATALPLAPADSVQISATAQQVAQLKVQALALPEIRADKVEQARAQLTQLSAGGAELDAKIAEKLLTEL